MNQMQQNLKDRQNPPEQVLANDALYLGDNGRCLCGRHHGMSARFTGRDLSGQRVTRVTKAFAEEYRQMAKALHGVDMVPSCEHCGRKA